MNVESISLSVAKVQFKNTHDHSKWAVSINSSNKNSWVCVGDINRAVNYFFFVNLLHTFKMNT
jgi:hypothetical protein